MIINVYNTDFRLVAIIDEYISVIWTDRYYKCGDFELTISANSLYKDDIKDGYYLTTEKSKHVMIVETIQLSSDIEGGDRIYISGRSLESILERRIIWGTKTLEASSPVQTVITDILKEAFLPEGSDELSLKRKVNNFEILENSELSSTPLLDPDLDEGYVYQFTGTDLYSLVSSICEDKKIGFMISLITGQIVFKLYAGLDRSIESNLGSVIFSKKYDNLLSSDFLSSSRNYRNVVLIGGETDNSNIQKFVSTDNDNTGLNRRELYIDGRNITSSYTDDNDNEVHLTETEYTNLLKETGAEKLKDYTMTEAFEGEMDIYGSFSYGTSFNIGDIVQIEDEYGHNKKCRVLEMVHSSDVGTGDTSYPTFEVVKENNNG